MSEVTREMISAAHGVTMKNGIVLSWETLRDIYLSMDALANHKQTSGSPLTDEQIDALSRTMVKGDRSVNWLCRAIERAHGIGEKE